MAAGPPTLLEIEGLSIGYRSRQGIVPAVRNVSMRLAAGESVGLVGESGCGKSTLAYAIMRYLGRAGRVTSGRIRLEGVDMAGIDPGQLRRLRGGRIAMIYQDPQSALNPSLRVATQLTEVPMHHLGLDRTAATLRAETMLAEVKLADPRRIMAAYPHQLSGGQQQRVMIAMALLADPALLLLDEPTTGLDVTVEASVVDLVADLRRRQGTTLLYISHNLGLIAQVCDRVAVMYAGEIVEEGPVDAVFAAPRHPYTIGLLACLPQPASDRFVRPLRPIRGQVPRLDSLDAGCAFRPRCDHAVMGVCDRAVDLVAITGDHAVRCPRWASLTHLDAAHDLPPPAARAEPRVLDVVGLSKVYRVGRRAALRANADLSFTVEQGRTLALVGESGCGKSTVARLLVGLETASAGTIRFRDRDLAALPVARRGIDLLRAIQMVFQNPDETLNPSYSVGRQIGRVLSRFGLARGRRKVEAGTARLLDLIRLGPEYADRLPRQLSGGQRQRVAIARAFAGEPDLVVADEPVSALDVSVRAAIIELLGEIQRRRATSLILIGHDLSLVRYVADTVVVMYLGRIMEAGPVARVFAPPFHPYTEALLSAVPNPDPAARRPRIRLEGELPSALDPPSGCVFHTRCPRRIGAICSTTAPPEQVSADGHRLACHIPAAELILLQGGAEPAIPVEGGSP